MNLHDPRYQNQGIHVDMVVFSVNDRRVETLLIKRAIDQYVGEWIIPGGAVYNNESLEAAAERELKEKTGLHNIFMKQFKAYGDPKRDPRKRMVSVAYIALIDSQKVKLLQKTPKTLEASWFSIDKIPKMAFDHNLILTEALVELRQMLTKTNIANTLLPTDFTLPQIQEIYEIVLGHKFDRRNFRRKLLGANIIKPSGKRESGKANRPANLYRFSSKKFGEVEII